MHNIIIFVIYYNIICTFDHIIIMAGTIKEKIWQRDIISIIQLLQGTTGSYVAGPCGIILDGQLS